MDIGLPAKGLAAAGLTLKAGGRTMLDGLDLLLAPQTLTAVLGASGSGKSALIRVLAGDERASGAIVFEGRDVAAVPPRRRGFGVVRQADRLHPRRTLGECVAEPLRLRGTPRAQRARLVEESLDLWRLTPYAGLLPGQAGAALSQRAMLARATVFGPRLLLLDDPFSHQDPSGRPALIAILRRVHALLGATTLLATGDGADALAAADRLAVLRAGAILQFGTPRDVWDRPQDAGVAALLGETNCLPGMVQEIEDDIALVHLACGLRVEAAATPGLAARDACLVTLRPDRIAIAPVPAAEMGEGALDATLIEARFEGETYRLRLLIGSGAELVVRRPAAAGLRGLAPGGVAAIAWQPHNAQAFRNDPA